MSLDQKVLQGFRPQTPVVLLALRLRCDITERKRLERELAVNAACLRTIVDTEPECVTIISQEGALLEMNPAGLKLHEVRLFAVL